MKLKAGYEVRALPAEEEKEQQELFAAYSMGLVTLFPSGWFFTKSFIDFADRYYEFKFKPTDTVIVTFPKCGTTWLQEIVWNMRYPSNLDDPIKDVAVNTRCPFIEGDAISKTPNMPPVDPKCDIAQYFAKYCPGKSPEDGVFISLAENIPDPRILKTHLPFSLLPPNMLETCKVVFVTRNPKDACVSYHHHSRIIRAHGYKGEFDTFFDLFINDKVLYAPYWKFMEEGWEHRNHPNFHLIHFEDLKADPVKEITKLDQFLETGLSSEIIAKVAEETSFGKMKERDSFKGGQDAESGFLDSKLGSFFRAGTSGSWKKSMTEEQNRRMDEWIEKHTANGNVIMQKF